MCRKMALFLIFFGAPLWAGLDLKGLTGVWESQTTSAAGEFLFRLNIRQQGESLKVSFDNPQEGKLGRPMQVRTQNNRIGLMSVADQVRFVGSLKDKRLVGTFYYLTQTLDLSFERVADEPPSAPNLLGARVDSSPFGKAFLGSWSGLVIPESRSGQLRVDIRLGEEDGHMTFSLDSPSQTAFNLQGRVMSLIDRQIKIKIPVARATYEGEISQDGQKIEGYWLQLGTRQKLDLEPYTPLGTPFQTPKAPFPYEEVSVVFKNQNDGVALYGTMTLPKGPGPFPAILITQGIFQADRDASHTRHKPYWVIADALTRKGFAVLRYDRRGVGLSDGSDLRATMSNLTEDALSGWHYLKTQPMIDSKRTGILGHSSGGRIALAMHQELDSLPFMVLLNASVLNGRDTFVDQMLGQNKNPDQVTQSMKLWQAIADTMRTDQPKGAKVQQIMAHFASLSPETTTAEARNSTSMLLLDPLTSFVKFDPDKPLASNRLPLLAIYGGNDPVVPAETNKQRLMSQQTDAESSALTVHLLPGINHYLQDSDSKILESLDDLEQTVSPRLLEILIPWLTKRVAN